MKALALCVALISASLLGPADAARRGVMEAYRQPQGRRLQDALIPSLAAAAAPASERGAGRGTSSSDVLLTALAYGDSVVACREWQRGSLEFDWPNNPTEYTAAGKTVPPSADVQKLTSLICSDPEAAGDQIRTAVQKGGASAQAAVFALFATDCQDEEAASDTFGTVIDAVNSGDPADIDTVSSWFTNFVEAADAAGIPVCLSLAVVDSNTGRASDQRFFHVTGPGPSSSGGSRSGRGSAGGTGSAGSSGTGTGTGAIGSGLGGLTGTTGTGQGGANP